MSAKRWNPGTIALQAIAAAGALIVLFPMYVAVITAFKSPQELARSFFAIPERLFLGNFGTVFGTPHFLRSAFNSFFVTAASLGLIVLFIPVLSWAIARNSRKRYFKFLYYYFIAGIFVPFNVIMVPLVKLSQALHMMNVPGLVVLNAACATIQGVFLFTGFVRTLPVELEEAARIDGCGVVRTFVSVIFPLLAPMIATFVVIRGLFIWNDFMMPLLVLNKSRSFWTLPLFQYNFRSDYTVDYGAACASYLIAILPVLVLYNFMQKYIVKGLTAGAVKS